MTSPLTLDIKPITSQAIRCLIAKHCSHVGDAGIRQLSRALIEDSLASLLRRALAIHYALSRIRASSQATNLGITGPIPEKRGADGCAT